MKVQRFPEGILKSGLKLTRKSSWTTRTEDAAGVTLALVIVGVVRGAGGLVGRGVFFLALAFSGSLRVGWGLGLPSNRKKALMQVPSQLELVVGCAV